MVLPISGFLPVPLPMMIPFMGAQSLVIGKMFGEGFQYGKRKISAMPNEEFNKLTFESLMSNARDEMQASIPTMQQAMQDMKPMVETVVHEFTNYLSLVIEKAPQQLGQIKTSIEDVTGFTELNAKLVKLIADSKTTSQSQDVLGDILVALGLERFGQSAGGVDMTVSGSAVIAVAGNKVTGDEQLTNLVPYKGKWYTVERLQQLINAQSGATDRLQTRTQVKDFTPQISKANLADPRRKAGQSAIMERDKLNKTITNIRNGLRSILSKNKRDQLTVQLRGNLQKLANLQARYRF